MEGSVSARITDNAAFNPGNTDFSFAIWWYTGNTFHGENVYVLAKCTTDTGSGGRQYDLAYIGGTARFVWHINATAVVNASSLGVPAEDTWYFIYVDHDATADLAGISVNAGTLDTAAWSSGVQAKTGDFAIGRLGSYSGSLYADGGADSVGYWSRRLTGAERTELYNGGAGVAYADIAGGGTTRAAMFFSLAGLAIPAATLAGLYKAGAVAL